MNPELERKVEEFRRHFWNLTGENGFDLERKQDEFVRTALKEVFELGRKEEREKNDLVLRTTSGSGGWLCYSQKNNTKPKFGATPEQALLAHLTTRKD